MDNFGISAEGSIEVSNAMTGHHDKKEYDHPMNTNQLPFKLAPSKETAAHVGLTLGATYNMGDFNSARVQVAITVPCDVNQIEEAYSFCQNWAEAKVVEYRNQLT